MVRKLLFLRSDVLGKKYLGPLAGWIIFLGILAGCNSTSSPVIPSSEAVLKLSIPKFVLNSKPASRTTHGVRPKNTLPDSNLGRLGYCLVADGQPPIKGSVNFNSGTEVGAVTIPLPKAGKWIVSAEWFQIPSAIPSLISKATVPITEYPEFAGADVVIVQGTTSFTLNMEDFDYNGFYCYYPGSYYPGMTDSGYDFCIDGNGYLDYFSFDSNSISSGGTGDIHIAYDSVSGSEYFTDGAASGTPVQFAYLGNGDLVNFATIPDNATYYATTLQAKAAVVGSAPSTMAAGDVYVVKGVVTPNGNNGKVWFQVDPYSPFYCTGGSSSGGGASFWFIYNGEGVNYMKFDETTYGHNNCNQNVVSAG